MNEENNFRSDLIYEKKNIIFESYKKIITNNIKENNFDYCTIKIPYHYNKEELVNTLTLNLKKIIDRELSQKRYHAFVVGIGNDSHTADSLGPKVLKHIKVNSYLDELNLETETNKVSTLEPGVLGETGIDTKRIIESVAEEIKPDIIIIIDALVTNNINNLNNTIQITNAGLTPGSGLKSINSVINKETLGIPVIVIGIPTAIEVTIDKKSTKSKTYFLSTNDIDTFIEQASIILGEALNKIFYNF